MKHLLRTLCLCWIGLSIHQHTHAQCTSSGPLGSTTGGNNTSIGSLSWTGTNRTHTLNSSYASASVTLALGVLTPVTTNTQYLTITGLGFSIPAANTICGIVVTINHRSFSLLTIGGTVNDNDIRLIKGGALVTGPGANHALAGDWPYSTASTASYGNSSDLWGSAWLPADINSSSFGVAISATIVSQIVSLAFSADIDQVTVTVFSGPSATLATTLGTFSAKEAQGGNTLSWSAATYPDGNDAGYFVIQRTADGRVWQDLATVPALAGVQNYSWTDASPLPGTNSYRLHLLNADGQGVYSAIQTLSNLAGLSAGIRCYPNPFTSTISIASAHPIGRIQITDLAGKIIMVKELNRTATEWQWPAAGLPPGLYFVKVDGIVFKLVKN